MTGRATLQHSTKKIDRIKGYFHFKFDAQLPRVVFLRVCDGLVTEVKLWKGHQELIEDELPPVVPPKGLTSERSWYLYDKIRRYHRKSRPEIRSRE